MSPSPQLHRVIRSSVFIILSVLLGQGIHGFSSETQIEGAFRAASSAGSLIACQTSNASIIVSYTADDGGTNLVKISDKICMAVEGIAADALFVADKAVEEHAEHMFVFNSEVPLRRLAGSIAQMVHRRTLSPFMRPFGIRALFVGVDGNRLPQVLEVDPLGSVHHCKIVFVGPLGLASVWGKETDPMDMSSSQCVRKCISVLKEALSNSNDEFHISRVKIAIVDAHTARMLEDGSIRKAMEEDDFTFIDRDHEAAVL